MSLPLLRPERQEGKHHSATWHYHARRLRARSARIPVQSNIPLRVGIPERSALEEQWSTKLDVLGPLLSQHYPVVPDGSRRNLMAAFDKRCNFYSDKRVDKTVVKASLDLLARCSPTAWDPIEWTPELFHSWNSQFGAAKQARHLKVYPKIAEVLTKQFSNKQIFVKVEALLKRHDPEWAPRIINQSSDLHNVLLGPIMQKCTRRMFSAFVCDSSQEQVNYMGAYKHSSSQMVDFIHRHGGSQTRYVESDFSANDMTQLRDVHLLEIQWLRQLGAPLWLTGLMLHANTFVVSSFKHSVMGVVKNQLPTGAQSTTFRNSLWNASINHAFCLRTGAKGDCLILGDDMLMRYDNPRSTRKQQTRREYEFVCTLAGMRAKVFVRDHLSECGFLSKQFLPAGATFVMVPLLGKALGRFNARASANEAVSDRAYLAGKALSYAYEFRHCRTISRCFLLRYRQLVPDGQLSLDGLGWNAKGAFLELGVEGILSSIDTAEPQCKRDDMTQFYHWKYSLTATDVLELCIRTIFGEDDIDEVGCERLLEDFL